MSRARCIVVVIALGALPLGRICAEPLTAIIHARAQTMTAETLIDDATIWIRDGRIHKIATGIVPPAGRGVLDAAGRIVTPGLMNAGTRLGLVEVSAVSETVDHAVSEGALGAAFDVRFAINPNSTLIPHVRADGLTRALSYPQASAVAPFAGSGVVLHLGPGPDLIDRPRAGMFVVIGGMSAAQVGGSRAAQWILLRNALEEARRYQPAKGVGVPRDQLSNRLDIEALAPVLAGEMPLGIEASRESDLRQAVALAEDFRIRLVLLGAAEAWRLAGLLADRRIPVVLDPTANLPATFDAIGARADNAALLAAAGVTIAFSIPGIQMSHNAGTAIREAAGLAVAAGLPRLEALRAITINPAMIWGIDDHYGTIEPGKQADLVIWDGDPLEPSSTPTDVIVQGEPMSLATRERALTDRYAPARAGDRWPPGYR